MSNKKMQIKCIHIYTDFIYIQAFSSLKYVHSYSHWHTNTGMKRLKSEKNEREKSTALNSVYNKGNTHSFELYFAVRFYKFCFFFVHSLFSVKFVLDV